MGKERDSGAAKSQKSHQPKKSKKPAKPKKKCCESKPKCKRCPLAMLKAGTLPPGYTVKKRRLVKVAKASRAA